MAEVSVTALAAATGRRRWGRMRRAAAIVLLAAGAGGLAWCAVVLSLPCAPGIPERLPAPLARLVAYASREPAWDALPYGPTLTDVRRRGELVVGVRAYPRPAPVGRPTPPEPDTFDVGLAEYLAARLHVRVRIVGLRPDSAGHVAANVPGVDLVLAGGSVRSGASTVASAYTGGPGQFVVLRGSPTRVVADLAGRRVCVASGSPYVGNLAGALPVVHESAIRAVSAFMAGECEALVEDTVLLDRLAGLPEWRFYRRLDAYVAPDNDSPQAVLATHDAASARWLDIAIRHWKTGGAFAAARERRAAETGYEAMQLLSGLVCHA